MLKKEYSGNGADGIVHAIVVEMIDEWRISEYNIYAKYSHRWGNEEQLEMLIFPAVVIRFFPLTCLCCRQRAAGLFCYGGKMHER